MSSVAVQLIEVQPFPVQLGDWDFPQVAPWDKLSVQARADVIPPANSKIISDLLLLDLVFIIVLRLIVLFVQFSNQPLQP